MLLAYTSFVTSLANSWCRRASQRRQKYCTKKVRPQAKICGPVCSCILVLLIKACCLRVMRIVLANCRMICCAVKNPKVPAKHLEGVLIPRKTQTSTSKHVTHESAPLVNLTPTLHFRIHPTLTVALSLTLNRTPNPHPRPDLKPQP